MDTPKGNDPLGGLPPIDKDMNRNPLAGLPPVDRDFNRNPIDLSPPPTTVSAAASAGTPVRRLPLGAVLLAIIGVAVLVIANAHAPTLDNVITQRWVLKPAAYDVARILGWGLVIIAVTRIAFRLRR